MDSPSEADARLFVFEGFLLPDEEESEKENFERDREAGHCEGLSKKKAVTA